MSSQYTLEQIAEFMATERLAIHGVSGSAYEQNTAIIEALETTAPGYGEDLLSVQIIGSRANGTSRPLSDLDLSIVTVGENNRRQILHEVKKTTEDIVPNTDTCEAAGFVGAYCMIPDTGAKFIDWVNKHPGELAALFEDGIYVPGSTIALRSAALAVLSAQNSRQTASALWDNIRRNHAYIYCSDLRYVRDKLWNRVYGSSWSDIVGAITADVIESRDELIFLPRSLSSQRLRLARMVDEIPAEVRKGKAFMIYDEVLECMEDDKLTRTS